MDHIYAFIAAALSLLRRFLSLLRRNLKKSIAIFLALLLVWLVYAVTRPKQAVYVTAKAERGDLRQLVEAVGTVTSEKALELQFPTLDVVAQVFVKEGDTVTAGQKLAQLRSGSLSASVAAASASVQSAQAALQALEEGSRPEDIAIVRAQVENKRASLDAAKQTLQNSEANLKNAKDQLESLLSESKISLSGQVTTAGSTISQHLASAKTAILSARGVFNANDVQDALVKGLVSGYDSLLLNMDSTMNTLSSLQSKPSPTDYQAALKAYADARAAIWSSTDILSRAYDIVSGLSLTNYFTNTSKETNKTTIAAQKTVVQSALSSLDAAMKSLQDASATYDSKIVSQKGIVTSLEGTRDRAKADISTFETSLKIDEAQLSRTMAPARKTDIDAARARVRQAQADLARAASQYRDTILSAPTEGIVTKVNVKAGEMRPSSEPSVTMLGNTPFRIEMFISEVDIPKVQIGQSGSIKLDAYRDERFSLHVGEIDTAATDKDGVPKYRAKLDFVNAHANFKVGMTGDAEIVTGFKSDVVFVPARAVIEKDGNDIVRVLNGKKIEERTVTTGMEGEGGNIEVSGIESGETVIVLEKK